MNTREVAQALGVSESTVQRYAKELGLTKNGKQTELDESAVTVIKTKIEDLRNVPELPIFSIFTTEHITEHISGGGRGICNGGKMIKDKH